METNNFKEKLKDISAISRNIQYSLNILLNSITKYLYMSNVDNVPIDDFDKTQVERALIRFKEDLFTTFKIIEVDINHSFNYLINCFNELQKFKENA